MADYIKGVFLKKKTGQYGDYFVISVTQEGIDAQQNLDANSDGFRVMIATPQRENPEKFSIKPFVKK